MLRLSNIKKDYKTASETVHALKGVSLSFRKNEFVSILGPSGCGKTTMLNIIGGLDHYTSGDLVINGKSTKAYSSRDWDVYRNHRIGFVFQSYNLIPHQTVLGNVELALTISGISKKERIARAKRALDRVGLAGQYNKRPNQLSGGQCQRVAIARALVNDPEILLADEPTGALDTVTSKQIMELIKEISGERLVIMVTHNPELADEYSTRIIRLLDGEVIEDTNPYNDGEDEVAEEAVEAPKRSAIFKVARALLIASLVPGPFTLLPGINIATLVALLRARKKKTITVFAILNMIFGTGLFHILFGLGLVPIAAGVLMLFIKEDSLVKAPAKTEAKADEEAEITAEEVIETVTEAEACAEDEAKPAEKAKPKKVKKPKKEKAKMSFFTSFMLSVRNLLSKKGRTTMVGFAGSIGIIGIAMVLAFSGGISGYIEAMQDDMLSGNPISITETAYDLEALSGMMGSDSSVQVGTPAKDKKPGNVYISSLVEYLATMESIEEQVAMENEITKEYVDYVKAMDKDRYSAMTLRYGIDLSQTIYTEFLYSKNDGSTKSPQSIKSIVDTCTSLLKETSFSEYADYVPILVPQFTQAPNNEDYILSQYDLVGEGSRVATEKNEIMLVIDEKDEISDLLLAMLGYYSQEEFQEIVVKATEKNYNGELYKASFTYEELLSKSLYWYPNDSVYTKNMFGSYSYNYVANESFTDGVELKVVGILKPKDDINFGCLSSGVYYTEALTNHILKTNATSNIIQDAINDNIPDSMIQGMSKYMILYSYKYTSWWYGKDISKLTEEELKKVPAGYDKPNGATGMYYVGISMSMEDIIGSMMGSSGMGGLGGGSDTDTDAATSEDDMKEKFIRALGGNDTPNAILIYPKSFDEMYMVTEYLEVWNTGDENCPLYNEDGTPMLDENGKQKYGVMIGDELYAGDRPTIKATNTIELIVGLMKKLVDIVTWALVGFTSVSLIVSTVMIGIITYVSVVERIKEIGVIRSLGGRKKDVANLFNAEAFIIGLLAGVFGIAVTYLVSLIVNLALKGIIGYSHIAALPWWQALLLIALSVGLTCLSGIIPASSAARKDPVIALRTE